MLASYRFSAPGKNRSDGARWLKSSGRLGEFNIAEVLRLRAQRRSAQDDGFVGGEEKHAREIGAYGTMSWVRKG